jgi:hypothetical protein
MDGSSGGSRVSLIIQRTSLQKYTSALYRISHGMKSEQTLPQEENHHFRFACLLLMIYKHFIGAFFNTPGRKIFSIDLLT